MINDEQITPELLTKGKPQPKSYRDRMKWIFLALLCISQTGPIYNMVPVQSLQKALTAKMGVEEFGYSLITQAESLSGILLPLFSGMFVDYYGGGSGYVVATIATALGQFISTFATYTSNYWLFLVARVILMSGIGIFILARNKMISSWYSDYEVGRVTSIAYLCQMSVIILCDVIYPSVYEWTDNLGDPFMVGSIVSLVAMIVAVVQLLVHKKMLHEESLDKVTEKKIVSLRAIKDFPLIFWLLCFSSIASIAATDGVQMYESNFLGLRFGYDIKEGGYFLAAGVVIAGIGAPVAGFLFNKYGRLPLVLVLTCTINLVGIVGNLILPDCYRCLLPAVPLMLVSKSIGMANVLAATGILLLINKDVLGVAFACYTLTLGVFMFGFSPLAGTIAEKTKDTWGYFWVFVVTGAIVACGLVFGIALQIFDYKKDKKLQACGKSREKRAELIRKSLLESQNNLVDSYINAVSMTEEEEEATLTPLSAAK